VARRSTDSIEDASGEIIGRRIGETLGVKRWESQEKNLSTKKPCTQLRGGTPVNKKETKIMNANAGLKKKRKLKKLFVWIGPVIV